MLRKKLLKTNIVINNNPFKLTAFDFVYTQKKLKYFNRFQKFVNFVLFKKHQFQFKVNVCLNN